MNYEHAEAFCLMEYVSDDGTESETIWNSRDGVTPFIISLRSGKQAAHKNWHQDQRVPDYTPPSGSRMFVDLSPERAKQLATARVRQYPEFIPKGMTFEQCVASVAESFLEPAGQPDIVTVP